MKLIGILVALLSAALCGCGWFRTLPRQEPLREQITLAPRGVTEGRIAGVQLSENFVVIEFSEAPPPLRTRLRVYRNGQQIGEVEVIGPVYPPFAAANILEGVPAVGDTVR